MEKMEVLRYELYEAIEKGEKKEILFLSRKLDRYIVQKTKELMADKEKHFM
jgi:sRNA-binding carbon storage regulator CsrA